MIRLGLSPTHLRHHGRFYLSLLAGLVAWGLASTTLGHPMRLIVAGDAFFGAYILSTAWVTSGWTVEDVRRRASAEDEGIRVIVFITLTAIVLSLAAIFFLINEGHPPSPLELGLSVATVPLSWFTFHTVLAFHYSHRFYHRPGDGAGVGDTLGLIFPETPEPNFWDFLYFSFVIGMTAQVSDVQVKTTGLRSLVLVHGVVSFFFNTVILALAVNLVVGHSP